MVDVLGVGVKDLYVVLIIFFVLGLVVFTFYPFTCEFFMKSWEKNGKPRNCNWCRYKCIREDYYEGKEWYCNRYWDSNFRNNCDEFRVGQAVEMGGEGDF